MASNYTGNQGATQAPSGPPTPDGNPVALLPATGDPRNAASVAQMVKVGMDWIAWLMKPRAIASAWAQATRIYRSAAGHKRFGIDHLGYPAGRLNHWREVWAAGGSSGFFASGTHSAPMGSSGWACSSVLASAGNSIGQVLAPDANWSQPHVEIQVGSTAGDYLWLNRGDASRFTADAAIVLDWDANVPDLSGNVENYMGFMGDFPGARAWARFHWPATGTNWLCETYDGTTSSNINSGFAAAAGWHQFRIEYHGANVDDAGTERVLFFIDGTLVANKTTNMPSSDPLPNARPGFASKNTFGGAGPWRMWIGDVVFSANAWRDAF